MKAASCATRRGVATAAVTILGAVCLAASPDPTAAATQNIRLTNRFGGSLVAFLPPNYPNVPPLPPRPTSPRPPSDSGTKPSNPPPVVPPRPPPPPPVHDDNPPDDHNNPPQPPEAPEPTTLISAIVGTGLVGAYSVYRRRRRLRRTSG